MQLTIMKGYDGDPNTLPTRTVEGAVPFKNPETVGRFSLLVNGVALIIMTITVLTVAGVCFTGDVERGDDTAFQLLLGVWLSILLLPLHEFLHAICYKEDVEFYAAIKRGLIFIVGTESMSRQRFIFMSLLPNLVLGVLPFILFFAIPSHPLWLGLFGAISLGIGAGDYINVFRAITQVPKDAMCFMSKNRSYWYMPSEQ